MLNCKDYCHRVKIQLHSIKIIIIIIITVRLLIIIVVRRRRKSRRRNQAATFHPVQRHKYPVSRFSAFICVVSERHINHIFFAAYSVTKMSNTRYNVGTEDNGPHIFCVTI